VSLTVLSLLRVADMMMALSLLFAVIDVIIFVIVCKIVISTALHNIIEYTQLLVIAHSSVTEHFGSLQNLFILYNTLD